jgi:hypothetical protein
MAIGRGSQSTSSAHEQRQPGLEREPRRLAHTPANERG